MKINTALILCAGLGQRLNPLTLKTPKDLAILSKRIIDNKISMQTYELTKNLVGLD